METYKYDITRYPFRKVVEGFLGTSQLETLYDIELSYPEKIEDYFDTKYHQNYLSHVRDDKSELKILYRRFIKEYISKLFDFDIMFEKEPFFRIHQENNTSLIKYHTDSDYLVPDGCHDMFRHEINFWMPVTKAYDTNSLWVESSPKKKDYSPINAEYGDIIQFDGPNLLHGTEINKTGQTRVSLDFRVVPKNIFSGEGHINPADYYDEI